MPEIDSVYQNEAAFAPLFWDSRWYNTGNSKDLSFTAYCNKNYILGVRWSVDDSYSVIEEESVSIVAGVSETFVSPVKSRFVQVFIKNIAATPSALQTQAFFFSQ